MGGRIDIYAYTSSAKNRDFWQVSRFSSDMIEDSNYYETPTATTYANTVIVSCVPQIWSFWSQFLVNFTENCPRQMLDFTANMHEI